MINPYLPQTRPLIGREYELRELEQIRGLPGAKILTVYGRRRVGKTSLLEYSFADRKLLKFEGLENLPEQRQLLQAKKELSKYIAEPAIELLSFQNWGDFFEALAKYISTGTWTIYLEEIQYLCSYETELISYLKYYWDNHFSKNPNLIFILCGSSPSFVVSKIIKSRALYNRSLHILRVNPFTFAETKLFLGDRYTARQTLDAALTLGGIPEYLKYLNTAGSDFIVNLCKESFTPNGFFVSEYDRIFTSSLAANPEYMQIIEFLASNKYAARAEILKALGLAKTAGGTISKIIFDLEETGFIERYRPFHLGENSKTVRYRICDPFLNFFAKFIKPKLHRIVSGDYRDNPTSALKLQEYYAWLGYEFEKFCIRNAQNIASALGFSGIDYKVGSFFYRGAQHASYQLDLVFARADRVYTICEIKYTRQNIGLAAVSNFEDKLARFKAPHNRHGIQRVLISAAGVTDELRQAGIFDRILGFEDVVGSPIVYE